MGKTSVTRRKFLKTSLIALGGAAVPVAGYSQFIEAHRLTTTHLDLRIKNLPEVFDGFRIAQLSDFHYGTYTGTREISAAVAVANALHPDLIVLTGDFITAPDRIRVPATHRSFTYAALCAQVLSGLKAPEGVFACLGNHDALWHRTYITEVLTGFHVRVLTNDNQVIERDGKRIWLAGLDDAVFGSVDFSRALAGIPDGEPVVLIAHEPDIADEAASNPIAVQLSGHSHGGQIRLPLVGAPYLPRLAQKYPFAYYRIGNMHLYTNRGIGTILLPYRFNAPPEVTLVTLRSAAKTA